MNRGLRVYTEGWGCESRPAVGWTPTLALRAISRRGEEEAAAGPTGVTALSTRSCCPRRLLLKANWRRAVGEPRRPLCLSLRRFREAHPAPACLRVPGTFGSSHLPSIHGGDAPRCPEMPEIPQNPPRFALASGLARGIVRRSRAAWLVHVTGGLANFPLPQADVGAPVLLFLRRGRREHPRGLGPAREERAHLRGGCEL
eukprot:1185579-Prorocentrum_minimum.AAC.1